jgi:two-component system NtrC family response regulator
MSKILIIDDDRSVCKTITDMTRDKGHSTESVFRLQEGLDKVMETPYDLVFLDMNLPDGNGIEAIPRIRQAPSRPEVIIITGEGTPNNAELAIKNEAWDYVQKPLSVQSVLLPLTRALQYRSEKSAGVSVQALRRKEIIGNSPEIQRSLDLVAKAAATEVSVLISGETGTGKELFARAIHDNSSRAAMNFVVVDCASLPATLVESVLFGYEKGAFTGAAHSREGLILQAHEGTLFLDEVGELPLEIQKNLLRVLQEQRFRPIGSSREVKSRFRLVAATNRDLEQMVREESFRQDLLFRLRGFSITLPSLRIRKEDIIELVMARLLKMCRNHQVAMKAICPDFMEILQEYDWPGNVRELFNTVETAFANAANEPTLFAMHLPPYIRTQVKLKAMGACASLSAKKPASATPGIAASCSRPAIKTAPLQETAPAVSGMPALRQAREEAISRMEQQYLTDILQLVRGDLGKASEIAGLSRSQLYRLIQKYNIAY